MKPREWWIKQRTITDDSRIIKGPDTKGELVCVVEKSEYDKLKSICEKLATALEFYSKLISYNESKIDGENRIPVYWEDMKGRRARLALAEYRAMRDETKMPCPDKDIDPLG